MRKKTRKRSYKNTIAIGIASFASIALLSTGLAAFVLIRDAQKTVDGNFVVAEVSEAKIELTITNPGSTETPKLILDADEDDNEGRVQIQQGGTGPQLTYNFAGTVEVAQTKTIEKNLDLYYTVNIKKGGSVANEDFTKAFINDEGANRYLSFVGVGEGLTKPVKIFPTVDDDPLKPYKGSFSFDFGFNWGAKYGNMNPSKFFDSTEKNAIAGTYGSGDNSVTYEQDDTVEGANIPDNVVQQELLDLQKAAEYTFEIVVHAKNK